MSQQKNNKMSLKSFMEQVSDTETSKSIKDCRPNPTVPQSTLPSNSTWGKKKVELTMVELETDVSPETAETNKSVEPEVLTTEESEVLTTEEFFQPVFSDKIKNVNQKKYTTVSQFSALSPHELLEVSKDWCNYTQYLVTKIENVKDPKKVEKFILELSELRECISALDLFNAYKNSVDVEFEYLVDKMRELKAPDGSSILFIQILKKLNSSIIDTKKNSKSTKNELKKTQPIRVTQLPTPTDDSSNEEMLSAAVAPLASLEISNVFFSETTETLIDDSEFISVSKKSKAIKTVTPKHSKLAPTVISKIVPSDLVVDTSNLKACKLVEPAIVFSKEDYLKQVNMAKAKAISIAAKVVVKVLSDNYSKHNGEWNTRAAPAGPNNSVRWFSFNIAPDENVFFTTPTSKQITLDHYFSNMDSYFLGKVKKGVYEAVAKSDLLTEKKLNLIPIRSKTPLEFKFIISVELRHVRKLDDSVMP